MSTEEPTGPYIRTLDVQGFQSLVDVHLDLAPYTVIVGPSSSGKSALVRALKTLHHNARGTSFVTTGFKRAKISATLRDDTTVTLTRSVVASSKDNAYTVSPGDSEPVVFTKLNGEVPEEVRALLPSTPDLTFASQFDKPYLLDSSPGDVARTLASLTNVHVVLSAAREANRRRLQASQTLRTRQDDLAAVESRTREFRALAQRAKAQDTAARLMNQATVLSATISSLSRLIDTAREADEHATTHARTLTALPDTHTASSRLRNAVRLHNDVQRLQVLASTLQHASRAAHAASAALAVPVPSLDTARVAYARTQGLRAVLVRLRDARAAQQDAQADQSQATTALAEAQGEYIGALQSAGTCPTCGQSTDHATADHLA